MNKTIDCLVCGTCVVDVLIRPVSLDQAIGGNRLWEINPLTTTVGGLVSNTGTAMARLGQRVAAFSRIGDDAWAEVLHSHFQREGIDTQGLLVQAGGATGATAVLIDSNGERSFAHHPGLPAEIRGDDIRKNFALFARSRIVLIGYYSLLPRLEPELHKLLPELQQAGCLTALESAGAGGNLKPLCDFLPHLDFYIPSLAEAAHQTGESDPQRILKVYRSLGAKGVIGVKLGSKGALLSPKQDDIFEIGCIVPPGPVRDTTGAGDAFYGGLLTGVLRGLDIKQAAKVAAATAACCVTGYGASSSLPSWEEAVRLTRDL